MSELDLTDIALHSIKNLIVTHQYRPGDRLLETVMAQELNLSRTPIRDALSRLESRGFLEKKKGRRGYWIPVLSPEDMKSVFRMRGVLEGYAARMASIKRSEEDVAYLKSLSEIEIKAFHEGAREDYSKSNELFHFTINSIADDVYLNRFFEQVFWRSELYDFFLGDFYNYNKFNEDRVERLSYEEHIKIINAIEKKEPEESEKLMRLHMKEAYKHFLSGKRNVSLDG